MTKSNKKIFYSFSIIFIILIAFLIIWFTSFSIVKVEGDSMSPDLLNKSSHLVTKWFSLRNNQIVVANFEDKLIVKKILALPGDTIQWQNGIISVNDVDISSQFHGDMNNFSLNITIPNDKIFLMGTNLDNSTDSRRFGLLNISDVKYLLIT